MENQRKNWRAEFFLKKKLENRDLQEKKICIGKILQKNFAIKKNSNLGSSAAPPPPALWDPPRRGPLSHCRDQGAALREGQRAGETGQPAVAAEDHRAHQPGRWGPRQRLHRWREREGEMDGCPRRQTAAPPPASWASPPLAWGDPETRSRSHGGGQRRRKDKQ